MSESQKFTTPFGPLPRDPERYTPTTHFIQRFKERSDPTPTGEVVRTCIAEGEPKHSHDRRRYLFEAAVDGHDWRVVVGIAGDTAPFEYRVLTIYATDADGHDAVEDYDQ